MKKPTLRMSRIKPFILAALLVVLALPAAAQIATNRTPSAAGPDKRPNIILIMADDLGYGSLGCYGSANIKTPNIDQIAASGMKFTDFHRSGTVCSPMRAALLTGRYPQRCAWVPDEELSPVFRDQRRANPSQRRAWGISPNEVTIPAVLRSAGYRTGLIGKWHLGYDFKFHPLNYGFDEFRGLVGGNVDYHMHVAGYGQKPIALVNLEMDLEEKNNRVGEQPRRVGDLTKLHGAWIASVGQK